MTRDPYTIFAVLCSLTVTAAAAAQDMMRYLDLTSPDMVSAEMTRAQVEMSLAAAAGHPVAFASGISRPRR